MHEDRRVESLDVVARRDHRATSVLEFFFSSTPSGP
jgi:hypothetical protein